MKNRLFKMAKCTGAKETEVKNLTSTGFIGLCAVAIVSLLGFGCARHEVKAAPVTPAQQPKPVETSTATATVTAQPAAQPAKLPNLNKSTSTSTGPWPGYPAGTKYHTVSLRDFEERAA